LKIRLDENLSYRVANALKAFLADRSGLAVSWVRDFHPPKTDDPTWLRAFSEDGGNAILSGDPNILQHWPNLIAYIESGCIGFFPPSSFGELKGFGQASLLIRWWPAIIEKTKLSQRGDCWRLPRSWTPDVTKFQKLKDPRIETNEQRQGHGIATAKIHQFRPPPG
jgi:PIN like domain